MVAVVVSEEVQEAKSTELGGMQWREEGNPDFISSLELAVVCLANSGE